MLKKVSTIMVICLLFLQINAKSPFKIMDDNFEGLNTQVKKSESDFFINYKIPQHAYKRGFTATTVTSSKNIKANSKDDRPFIIPQIKAFANQGQYVLRNLAVNFLEDTKYFKVTSSCFKSKTGHSISSDNIRVFRIISKQQNKKYSGDFLMTPELQNIPGKSVVFFAVLINVPSSAQSGLYKGSLNLKGNKGDLSIPMSLRVLNGQLPCSKNSFGMYMPGHFHDKVKGYTNWTPEFFTSNNISKLFKFWKTRKLNSPSLFHVYPEWKKQEPDFTTLGTFANAMKTCGLDGYLCVDTRFYAWYADAKAKQDTNKAKHIYSDIISRLLSTAKEEKWPKMKVFAEEEIGNGGKKITTYRKYWPSLRKLASGEDYIIDNDIGYGRKNAVDRGARDKFKVRQYNSWTANALKAAQKDKAEIWTYNYGGYNRGNFGFLQQRLNSKANHQWADMWQGRKGSGNWIFCLLTDKGVVSSLQYERVHEGINDFAYCSLLKQKIAKLQSTNPEKAQNAQRTLDSIVEELPLNGPAFRNWMKYVSDDTLDLKRWQLALAVNSANKALGQKHTSFSKGLPGKIQLYSAQAKKSLTENSNLLYLPIANGKLMLDGKTKESFWKGRNSTGALKITKRKEAKLRAYSSTDAEFRKLSSVSYSTARVAYSSKGILIGLVCNHVTPTSNFVNAKHNDDDGNMWRDDCMEFFIMPNNAKSYFQLIVNSRGKKVLLNNGKAISSRGIDIATVSPINKSGGYGQEIFIPWESLGLKKAPSPGTLWKFNVAREFHAWQQYTSWSRVYASFHESDKWGKIIFTGKKGDSLFSKIKINSGLPGINKISGEVKIPASLHNSKLKLVLQNATGETICSRQLTHTSPRIFFNFNFRVPRLSKDENWKLKLMLADGKTVETLGVPAYSVSETIKIKSCDPYIIAGEMLKLRITANVSNTELAKYPLKGMVTCIATKEKTNLSPIKLTGSGDNKLWIKTTGMKPGQYNIQLWIANHGSINKSKPQKITVLPSPYSEDQ